MKRRTAIPILAIAGAVSLAYLFAGDTAENFTIRADVRLVLLDVSVTNREGGLVAGLTQDKFRVFDNGKPVDLSVFANNDVPVTVGILVDESYSMAPKRKDVLDAALTFIEASNPRDEVFVLNFNDTVRRGLPHGVLFSDNIAQLQAALDRGRPEGKTAFNDAIVAGLRQLELGKRDKKTLVLISDGGDNASRSNRREMVDLVEKSAATIYTIGLFDEGDVDRNPGILRQLAKMTGGEAYFPETPAGMIPVCRDIATSIRTRYTLGYRPPAEEANRTRHRIRVEVAAAEHGRLTARTRTGYWNEAAESAQENAGK
ncbi:MAG: VWA domain-containing protein [Bryobacteraceae bacterium]